jgi:hypothetical protein
MSTTIPWPDGKQFAFTVFDDTDDANVENVTTVYSFLRDCGFRTTKSCWPVAGDPNRGTHPGQTCQDPDYLRCVLELQSQGFEMAWHSSTWHGLHREGICAALEAFARFFGHYPVTATNHSDGESIYWGDQRLTGWHSCLYELATLRRNQGRFRGHVEGDEYFWGDLCQAKIKYFRNFVFHNLDTLKVCPFMPYHDPDRPYVNHWFASTNGRAVVDFNRRLCEANQDRLEADGGACIMYTHFASGFSDRGKTEPRFRALMERLARKNGWFVPVATLLDYLLAFRGQHNITNTERKWLERKWLLEKFFTGTT